VKGHDGAVYSLGFWSIRRTIRIGAVVCYDRSIADSALGGGLSVIDGLIDRFEVFLRRLLCRVAWCFPIACLLIGGSNGDSLWLSRCGWWIDDRSLLVVLVTSEVRLFVFVALFRRFDRSQVYR
jgi:hypothetical protein